MTHKKIDGAKPKRLPDYEKVLTQKLKELKRVVSTKNIKIICLSILNHCKRIR